MNGLCLESDYSYTSGSTSVTGSCNSKSCTKKKLSIGETVLVMGEQVLDEYCPGMYSDHAVIAVGYDEGSYKLRNSWGADWNEAGHILVKRGVSGRGVCNVAEFVVFPKIEGSTPTKSPSPATTRKPTPTTPQPDLCADCIGCFYPDANQCLTAEFTKDACDFHSAKFGTVWCGDSPTPTPKPTLSLGCGTCDVCYDPAADQCFESISKNDCQASALTKGYLWCGK
ncbi:hypothetical protein H310_02786 [Aphanomyces invadans]|uniref:Peptidase C1A papain C-terminal domain-containing protein n=1 Tax=Aphanomyces invadans TaxID=157072 RepID=A0A024UJT9_9STRA|nr:hypothetical protein H310_02786 [Aphanomyces invadans]ETW06569.1 hypothetical protein H310_02786 [Aphanomyces invadans]|eukprot:XP_008864644.1 hypothetical protein H310_02786 [Aphanomyces invadans]